MIGSDTVWRGIIDLVVAGKDSKMMCMFIFVFPIMVQFLSAISHCLWCKVAVLYTALIWESVHGLVLG